MSPRISAKNAEPNKAADLAQALISELRAKGVAIWREGDNVRCRGPNNLLSKEIAVRLKSLKPQLLAILSGTPEADFRQSSVTPNIALLDGRLGAQPVFFVHAIDGCVAYYAELAHELAYRRFVSYGLYALDVDGKACIPSTISSISRMYIEQVLTVQKEGIYALVGWSSGAMIAFEMACQLSIQHQRTVRLTILDSTMPDRAEDHIADLPVGSKEGDIAPAQCDSARLWRRFLLMSGMNTDNPEEFRACQEFWTMDDREKCDFLFRNQVNPELSSVNIFHAAKNAGDIGYLFRIMNVQFEAIASYVPSKFPAPINIVMANYPGNTADANTHRMRVMKQAWEKVTAGIARFECVAGHHDAVVKQPGIGKVAECIVGSLES